ncbi:hypothetical protein [Photobacterium sp. TY1-4]|uniref:hypothetical protein n=1 Tax=Photobacterium sp. TY1-4 TaxID=2899122 RepID=UPI0021C0B47B|nr:hypothetical protein [Photobacterium sp. TY1-4]UXI03902.1 hypothetical protein NH461_17415 [Photobacterium sp. TY1-4]
MIDEMKELKNRIESSIVTERNHIFKYTSPLINPNSSEAKTVYHEYDRATCNARYYNYNIDNIPSYGDTHIERMEVTTFHDFLAFKLKYNSNQSRKFYAQSQILDYFRSHDEEGFNEYLIADYEFEGETDHKVFRAWLMFEHLFDISSQIASRIETKNFIGIQHHLRLIDDNFGFLMNSRKSFFQLKMNEDELYSWLLTEIESFKHRVEEKGLWRSLSSKPEKQFQRIFEAVLGRICELYDVDISPETSTGNGIVDFKFSQGNGSKICVELKLSQNQNVLNGLVHQLTQYQRSEKTDKGIYIVLNSGNPSKSYFQLIENIKEYKDLGLKTDHVILIDATEKLSASKQK